MVFAFPRAAGSPSAEPEAHWSLEAAGAIRAAQSRAVWAQDVARALESLPQTDQAFIALSYFEGLGHAQIAARAGVPLATVSRTIAAAMQHIASAMQPN